MRDPRELYELDERGVAALAAAGSGSGVAGLVLLHHFEGFMDAGDAGAQVIQYLLEQGSPQVLARFDHDRLVDYRARRPAMTFDQDAWTGYQPPEILFQLVRDAVGTPFLVLSGPEPDTEWELFGAAVRQLAERFKVRLAVDFHGIPMGVPHTRPVGLTSHGTRMDLAADHPKWFDRAQVPASAQALLEYRLAEAGHDVLGFSAHVPHYISRAQYPAAAVAILEAVQSATGLVLPATELRAKVTKVHAEIQEQLTAGDGELGAAIQGMEGQYDALTGAADRESLLAEVVDLPSGDELGRRFEEFLAERDRRAE